MPRDGSATRETLLDAAHEVVLERGFAGASIEAILERAGVSRGTLFYHFPTKDALSRRLIARHAEADRELTDEFLARAERLARDPLQQLLVFFGLYIDMLEESTDVVPGCLFATFAYEAGLFDEETNAVVLGALDHWREVVGAKIREAALAHPTVLDVDADALADYGYTVFEGAMIVARVRGDPRVLPAHLRLYREHLEILFAVAGSGAGRGG